MSIDNAEKILAEYVEHLNYAYIKKGLLSPPAINTIRNYTLIIRNMLKSGLPPEEYAQQYCIDKKATTRTAFLMCIKQFFRWMIKTGKIEVNPFEEWKYPKIPREFRETQDLEELTAMVNIIMTHEQRLMLSILLDTSCRRCSLLRITESDLSPVDSKAPSIRLTTKGGKIIYSPLQPETLQAIRESFAAKPRKYLFESPVRPGMPLSDRYVDKAIKEIFIALGKKQPGIGLHTIRRSVITEAIREGVPVPLVQKLAGHESFMTTMRYVHLNENDLATLHTYALFQSKHNKFTEKGGGNNENLTQK
jgi:integrase/recombinase XerD